MAKQSKTKEARVDIVLPDGTKIVARGPMAEQMARRLMDPGWWNWWPYRPSLIGVGSNTLIGVGSDYTWTTSTTPQSGTVAIYNADGSHTDAGPDEVRAALGGALPVQ